MKIIKERTETNRAFTAGPLSVNGETVAHYTLEHTTSMIPAGTYQLTLVHEVGKRHRQLAIVAEDYEPSLPYTIVIATLISGNSYRNVINKSDILLGEKIISGAVIHSRDIYNRLFERIEKCIARGERITLHITNKDMSENDVPKFWLATSDHGCKPTTIHCETNSQGDVLVFDDDKLIKTLTIEDQKQRYNSED